MNDFAKVDVVGRLTRDPLKFGSGDTRCAVFTVAVNRTGKDGTKYATFVSAIAWGNVSDIVASLTKGTRVNLVGELEFHKAPKKEVGEMRVRTTNIKAVGETKNSTVPPDDNDENDNWV